MYGDSYPDAKSLGVDREDGVHVVPLSGEIT